MEGIIVNHQRGRFKGISIDKIKDILWGSYYNKERIGLRSLELDHIIPFSISLDNKLPNLQLLTPKEHKEKTIRDIKIIKKFKKKGWIEKITNYSHELKKPINFIKNEYLKEISKVS